MILLCIDDSEEVLKSYKSLLEDCGHTVFSASSGREGLTILEELDIDLVVLDYEMPEMNGYEVARQLRAKKPSVRIIINSGIQDIPAPSQMLVDGCFLKGREMAQLLPTIEEIEFARSTFSPGRAMR